MNSDQNKQWVIGPWHQTVTDQYYDRFNDYKTYRDIETYQKVVEEARKRELREMYKLKSGKSLNPAIAEMFNEQSD